jgi:Zn-dependent protease
MVSEEIWDDKTNSYIGVDSIKRKKNNFWAFSKQEKIDLLISWITLSIAFTLVIINFNLGNVLTGGFGQNLTLNLALPISFVAVGTGFVFHELAHRQAARHYGFVSEYRAWYPMLGLAVIFAIFTGWILAAPGATYFFGNNVTRKQNGVISVSGPLTNISIGLIMVFLLPLFNSGIIQTILMSASMINFFFAFFNLLPIWVLDGKKVLAWNPKVWFLAIIIPAIAVFFPGLIYGFFL